MALSDLWFISHGAAKSVRGKQGPGVALTLLCRAPVPGWGPGVQGSFEGFSKLQLQPFEQQQQQGGSVEGGAETLQVCDSRFAGSPRDNVTKVLFSSFHFAKGLSGHPI